MKNNLMIFVLALAIIYGCFQIASAQNPWTSQESGTSNNLNRVQFIDLDNGYAVGDAGIVLKTTNGGSDWTSVSIETDFPIRDLSFVDGSTGWVVTGDPDNSSTSGSVWFTSDGGTSWTEQSLGTTQARLGVSFVSSEDGWACGANNGPWDIRATTDGGASWHSQSGSGFGWTYDIDCISSSTGWSVGVVYFPSSSGFVMKTSDGGANWTQLNTGTVPFLYGIDFVDSDNGYAVGDAGAVLATTDGGTGWNELDSGVSTNLTDLSFISASAGWICGEQGTVLATDDGGSNWSDLPTGLNLTLNGINFIDSLTGWVVGESGTILKYNPDQTGINDSDINAPVALAILGSYPNPFNNSTMIGLSLERAAEVSLEIYDLTGRKVETLYAGELNAGEHEINWNAEKVSSGVYFARVETQTQSQSIKMLLLK